MPSNVDDPVRELDRGLSPAQIAVETLASPRFRARVRALAGLRERYSKALVREFVGRAHEEMRRQPREAAQYARLGEIVAVEIRDGGGRIDALRALAQASMLHGRFPVALKALDAAVAASRKRGEEDAAADLDVLRLEPLIHRERYHEARATGDRSLALFERQDNHQGLVRTHLALADLALRVDRPRAALRHYTRIDR
ncbi:MAG: tetratricopeptide repeat protein, partial [Planctomycetota bacterium]